MRSFGFFGLFGGDPTIVDGGNCTDDNDHGTHTTGTMVGDDGLGNRIGVAPGARWIACRNMDRGNRVSASRSRAA